MLCRIPLVKKKTNLRAQGRNAPEPVAAVVVAVPVAAATLWLQFPMLLTLVWVVLVVTWPCRHAVVCIGVDVGMVGDRQWRTVDGVVLGSSMKLGFVVGMVDGRRV